MTSKRTRPGALSDEVMNRGGLKNEQSQNKKRKIATSETDDKQDDASTDSEEDAIYLQQSQLLASTTVVPRENEPADYGIIELIKLENFMCHPCLEMKFGPFMNFVVGQNGSGKSAVLSALTLCLGAKAAVTNRGGNIRSFIKEGEHTAIIEVHLRNRGDGFKRDVYGDTIIIQRSFNRDGVNSYRTKTKSGKVVSSAKKELSDIIDYMSLQVDNPMTVLSQDLARQFLSNSTDEDKYKFFMKGVQLDDLYALYQTMRAQQTIIESVLESKAEDIGQLKENKEVAEKRFRLLKQTEDIRNTVQQLLLKHAWAQVLESESRLEAANEKLSDCEKKRIELEQELEKTSAAIVTWKEKAAATNAAVESFSDSINPLKEKKKELDEKVASQENKLSKIQAEERTLYQHIKQAKAKIDKAQRDVDAEQQRLSEADNGQHAFLQEEKDSLQVRKGRLEAEQVDIERETESRKEDILNSKTDLQQVSTTIQQKETELKRAQETLKLLASNCSDNLDGYGQNVTKLLNAIDGTTWRAGKPIGPIGLFVRLKRAIWSPVLERQLNRVLGGFIALSPEDKDRLMNLTREHRCDCNVYYTSPNPFQLQEPADDYLTILRALEIKNDDVRKTLVMINSIEQTILVEDHMEGKRIMERSPQNVRFCYAINKQRPENGFSIRMGQSSGGLDPIIGWKGASRIASSIEEQTKRIQDIITSLKGDLVEERSRYAELKRADENAQKAAAEKAKRKQKLKTDIQRLDDQIEDLVHRLEQDNSSQQLEKLKQVVEANRESYGQYLEQQEDNANEKQRISNIKIDLDTQVKELDAKIEEFNTDSDNLQRANAAAIEQRERAVLAHSSVLKKIEEHKAGTTELERSAQEEQEKLTGITGEAEEIGERVILTPKETTKNIETRLEHLNAELEKRDASIGASTEHIAKDFADKTEKYNDARKEVADLEMIYKAFDQAFEERMERWHYFRKYISVQSRLQFHFLMSEREFDGRLAFDHKKGILQLKVQPSQQATDTQRNAKTLSGGEKSFSQICLLLALWEAMGSPFRCLDEFDVFMDAVNRGVSMGLIIKAARNSVGKQFILITPQDVSTKGIDETADVRIVRMPDPQRNQGRLQIRGQ